METARSELELGLPASERDADLEIGTHSELKDCFQILIHKEVRLPRASQQSRCVRTTSLNGERYSEDPQDVNGTKFRACWRKACLL
ncbi:hypothetical protein NDU88_009658 [Pleurodeles waltl]|uniref:Uncharacterized protein n=1 Tax=Pleurodeles waltl TaxID=8319 RepID=A0AAV7PVI4_PLEWA|nr:hypothetical protein NDU88_009658 [Pleurodeles waltl]